MTTEIQQENNVSECLPKKFDRKAYYKAWCEANKEKRKAYREAYREANKERILEDKKAYREANKEKISEYKKAYREANKEKLKAYREANKEKITKRNKAYRKKRKKEDPLFATKIKLRQCVMNAFRRIKQNKPTNTQTLLGCSWQEAKEHFERLFKEGMSWENYGEWHIDHIRPVSSFSEDELHLMNRISNLQPLWAGDNFSKGATIPPTPEV